jgi:hypothetical protein
MGGVELLVVSFPSHYPFPELALLEVADLARLLFAPSVNSSLAVS